MFKFFFKLLILILAVILIGTYFLTRDKEPQELALGKIDDLTVKKVRLIGDKYLSDANQKGLDIILDLSSLGLEELEQKIKQYQNYTTIKYWQIKSQEQMHLIKAFDKRPIIIADTGELSTWWSKSRIADVLGIAIYRESQNKFLRFFDFQMPSWAYKIRARIIRKPIIITELDQEMIDFAKSLNIAQEAYVK